VRGRYSFEEKSPLSAGSSLMCHVAHRLAPLGNANASEYDSRPQDRAKQPGVGACTGARRDDCDRV